MSTARVYASSELVAALAAQFPCSYIQGPIFMNDRYCAVTRKWVEGPFSTYLWEFEIARGQITWLKRANQCEHFALRAALEAIDLFRQMPDDQVPSEAESLAVAACKYLRSDGKGWHEVNLWILDGSWSAWEPQQRAFFTFTEAERLTVQQIILP
jgi:hypothetical protein